MFEEILQYAQGSCEWNHIVGIHIFVAQPKEEQVGHVVVMDNEGDISFCPSIEYQDRFKLPLLEGRIRTLGFRILMVSEDESSWHKDIYFHKGMVYTSNHL